MANSKQEIIDAYSEMVNDKGVLIGEGIFLRESGISRYTFRGGLWRSWAAFQAEAGYEPNKPQEKIPEEIILRAFAQLALDTNAIPTIPDLILKRKEDPSFPGISCFRRGGSQDALASKVAEYCRDKDQFAPVLTLLDDGVSKNLSRRLDSNRVGGFVYLLRSGKRYKLGRTNAVGRRLRELAIQLPQKPNTVHVIETDDPEGIEQYWHQRFADKREGGEWFALTPDDVRAFKRRRFQ
jgi:hypothetical protein